MNPRLEAALARAREGAYIIPIWWTDAGGVCRCPKRANCPSPGKHPLTARGLHDASGDLSTIERWWRQSPEANVAVRTDAVPRIDIDLIEAADALLSDPELPFLTEVVRTPRAGLHMALCCPGVATSNLKLADGRNLGDLKAASGYVLVPPSRVGVKRYELLSPAHVTPLDVTDPMAWLGERLAACGLTLAQARPEPAYRGVTATVAEGSRHAALTSHGEEVAPPKRAYEELAGTIHEGAGRHNALKSYAGLVWIDGMSGETLIALLRAVNDTQCRPPLPDDELNAIARHFMDHRDRRVMHDPAMVCGDERPVIMITNRHRREIAAAGWEALIAANDPVRFFRHGNSVAEIRTHDKGHPIVRHLGSAGLGGRLDRCADFVKWTEEGDRPARPPRDVVEDMEALEIPLPTLAGIVGTPVFTEDGVLATAQGYQPETGLYYAPVGEPVPPVPSVPDDTDLRTARSRLGHDLFGDFPWADDASLANLIGALVTPMAREIITGPTPLFAFDAPKAGNGKGLLASCVGIIATGHEPPVMSDTKSEEEFRKRVTAKLIEGAGVVLFDNIRRRLDSGTLAALLTSNVWSDRVLGRSQAVDIPVRTLWLMTGNNLQYSDEIVRRTVSIRIDAKTDRPWEREGFRHPDLLCWLRRHRHEVVWACLVLVQNWIASGRPEWTGSPMGSYEPWCRVVGGILEAAKINGFLKNRPALYRRGDAASQEWRSFTEAWWAEHGSTPVKVADLQPIAEDTLTSLFEEIKEDASDRVVRTRLGKAIAERQDTRFGDIFIRRAGGDAHTKAALWNVERRADDEGFADVDPEIATTSAGHPQDNESSPDSFADVADDADIDSGLSPRAALTGGEGHLCGEVRKAHPQYPHHPHADSESGQFPADDVRVSRPAMRPHPQCKRCRRPLDAGAMSNLCATCRAAWLAALERTP